MVGGKVCGVSIKGDEVHISVAEKRYWKDPPTYIGARVCCVRARYGGEPVKIGDEVWWQCGKVYWTPCTNGVNDRPGKRCGVDYDIPLEKLGYSHDGGICLEELECST